MPTEEEMYAQQYNQMQQQGLVTDAQLQREQMSQVAQAKELEKQDAHLAEAQLEIEKELERFQNLLKGKVPVRNEHDELVWQEPPNNDEILLSEEGVNLIMRTVRFYATKMTLLSNYDEDTILQKMEDISTSLADALFMNYEKYFLYPTAEDVEQKLIARLKKRQKNIIATHKLRQEEYNEDEIWEKLVDEINPTKEREKIREGIIKDKLKGYDLLLRKVQDFIHSAYMRSWRGEERRTIRQHWHISENRSPPMNRPQQQPGMFGWLKR